MEYFKAMYLPGDEEYDYYVDMAELPMDKIDLSRGEIPKLKYPKSKRTAKKSVQENMNILKERAIIDAKNSIIGEYNKKYRVKKKQYNSENPPLTTAPRLTRSASGNYKMGRYDLAEAKTEDDVFGIYPHQFENFEYTREQGRGLTSRKKRAIFGRGSPKNRQIIGNMYIDLDKLKKNILFCKYAKSNTSVPKIPVQIISQDLADCIFNIISHKFNLKEYGLLSKDEKRTCNTFIHMFKFNDIPKIPDADNLEFQRQYEIIYQEYMAGNNSPELINKLKQYIKIAIKEGYISNKEGLSLLIDL